MSDGDPRYALGKLDEIVRILATGEGIALHRLLDAYALFFHIAEEDFPDDLRSQFVSINADIERRKKQNGYSMKMSETDALFVAALAQFTPVRHNLLAVFPFLSLMHTTLEGKNEGEALVYIEATLFNVFWVDRSIERADLLEQCRKKIADILWSFTDDCTASYLRYPVLCVWAVVRSLIVERNARANGVRKFLRSREARCGCELRFSQVQIRNRGGADGPFLHSSRNLRVPDALDAGASDAPWPTARAASQQRATCGARAGQKRISGNAQRPFAWRR